MMSIKPDFSTEITIKPSDGVSIEVDAKEVSASLAESPNMLYTWALLPARIDNKVDAVQLLDALLATQITYTRERLQDMLVGLVADNSMTAVDINFDFEWYGDYCLYAQFGDHLKLYVFCAGYNMPVDNKAQIFFYGVDISADWQPPKEE